MRISKRFDDYEFIHMCKDFLKSKMSIRRFCKEKGNITRSYFHYQIHDRLPLLDKRLYNEIYSYLKDNHRYRHIFKDGVRK